MTLEQTLQAFFDAQASAYRAKDWQACAAMYAEDGAVYSPFSPPAQGKAQVEDLYRRWTRSSDGQKRLIVTDAGQSGELAWCILRNPDGTGKATSLNLLQRQQDGSWKIRVCSINANDYDEDA